MLGNSRPLPPSPHASIQESKAVIGRLEYRSRIRFPTPKGSKNVSPVVAPATPGLVDAIPSDPGGVAECPHRSGSSPLGKLLPLPVSSQAHVQLGTLIHWLDTGT